MRCLKVEKIEMKQIAKKTLDDLEFGVVLEQAAARCATESGKAQMISTEPNTNFRAVQSALKRTNEYLSSFSEEKPIPNHGFEDVSQEISLLSVENSKIEVEGFRRLLVLSETANTLLVFLKKNKDRYPGLFEATSGQLPIKEIPTEIHRIVDKFGEIKDRASDTLHSIRRQMNGVRSKISQSFGAALSTYQGSGFLDEIRETVIGNRRVLAVKSMYRRKVKGVIHGSSKTGSIVYIEPETTLQFTQELQNLLYDEKEEIDAILRALTDFMRPFDADFTTFSNFLTLIDTHAAKAYYAKDMNAVLPVLTEAQEIDVKNAYHPLLYLSNKRKKNKTYPQDIHLHPKNRIIVISGPNAGGKSITLKTIGLLQLMLQSGFLIPVHEQSHMGVFERILTDIGDNQSIENELSTYSYRLKNMQRFLKKCDDKTLFLIDEFGTGSDPELGGALAEIFLEVFYERESFGAITTHYSNLKLLANELPHMTNANMQFDGKSLEPTFHLVTGEARDDIWLEYPLKKTGKERILYNDAVEEALCFGWIDSSVKSLDEQTTIQRFCKRGKNSTFSQPNKERLKWLFENNLIHNSIKNEVLKIIEQDFIFPEDIIEQLKMDKTVWENYERFSEPYKRIRIAYIDSSRKRPEEFEKRLNNFIDKTKENKLIKGFGGIDKYY